MVVNPVRAYHFVGETLRARRPFLGEWDWAPARRTFGRLLLAYVVVKIIVVYAVLAWAAGGIR